jgi:hypothetical protein
MSAAKAAAHRAVDATNAHTEEMQEPTRDMTSPAPASAQASPASAPAQTTASAQPATGTIRAASPTGGDSGGHTISVTERGSQGEMSLNREIFSYDRGGRRDPFESLLRNGDLRPMLSDLRLVTVLFDPSGRNSIAVMHDASSQSKDQYRVRVGQMLGRMRVAEIDPRQVVFTIEEIGYSRQAVLALGDSTQARTQ